MERSSSRTLRFRFRYLLALLVPITAYALVKYDAVSITQSLVVGALNANSVAAIDIESTTKGLLPPRMTSTQQNAISSPPQGLMIYDTTTDTLNYQDGSSTWQHFASINYRTASTLRDVAFTASVATNAMTLALKSQVSGSDPSADFTVGVAFRSATATSGQFSMVNVSSAKSIVVPQNATLGLLTGSVPQYVWVYLLNDAGAVDVCVSGISVFSDNILNASTAISGSATSGSTLYCSLSHSGSLPTRMIGNVLVTNASNLNWTTITRASLSTPPQPQPATAYLQDQETSGTSAQTIASGSYVTRTLNTLLGTTTFITLSSNQFSLVPGKYDIHIICPINTSGGGFSAASKCKLRNITGSSDVFFANSILNDIDHGATGAGATTASEGRGTVTVTSNTVFEVQQQVTTTVLGGFPASFGDTEVYAQAIVQKLDYYGP